MSETPTARDQVVAALSSVDGRTAREISDGTGLKYSTVTEHLRSLAEEGLARKEKSGRQVTWYAFTFDADARRDASATGARVVDEQPGPSGPVPIRTDAAPSETAVAASDALDVAETPTDAGTAVTGAPVCSHGFTHTTGTHPNGEACTDADEPAAVVDLAAATSVGDVAAFMEQQRPIPPAPETPPRTRRPRGEGAAPAREVRNDFGSGGLQTAMLRWMDEQPRNDDGSYRDHGPYEVALALKAHASSVAYSFKQTTKKGQTVRTTSEAEKPRYRLVTADETAAANATTAP